MNLIDLFPTTVEGLMVWAIIIGLLWKLIKYSKKSNKEN